MKAHTEGTPLEWLEGNLKVLSDEIYRRFGEGMVMFMLNYLAQSKGRINVSTMQGIAGKIDDRKVKRKVMTWAESLKQEGAREGIQKGLQKGRKEGRLIGRIVTYRELLGLSALPEKKLESMSVSELEKMVQELKKERAKGPKHSVASSESLKILIFQSLGPAL